MTIIKNFFTSPAILAFFLLLNVVLTIFSFKLEKVDLPNATKKLIVDTVKRELVVKDKKVENLENVVDEISYASQLGRLDTVSLLLAIFGLVLGFGAVAGFMHIKEASEQIAESAAGEEVKKWISETGGEKIEKAITEYMNKRTESNKKTVLKRATYQEEDLQNMVSDRGKGDDFFEPASPSDKK